MEIIVINLNFHGEMLLKFLFSFVLFPSKAELHRGAPKPYKSFEPKLNSSQSADGLLIHKNYIEEGNFHGLSLNS